MSKLILEIVTHLNARGYKPTMNVRTLLYTVAALAALILLASGTAAGQSIDFSPQPGQEIDPNADKPVVWEDARFDVDLTNYDYDGGDLDADTFEMNIRYPDEIMHVGIIQGSNFDLDVERYEEGMFERVNIQGEATRDITTSHDSTLFSIGVNVDEEHDGVEIRAELMRIIDTMGVPECEDGGCQGTLTLEAYPHPEPEPDIELTEVSVQEDEVPMGERVTVDFEAENFGDDTGNHTAELLLEGDSIDEERSFTLRPEETYSWDFWVTLDEEDYPPGEYTFSIDGETDTVKVLASELHGIETGETEVGAVDPDEEPEGLEGNETAELDAEGNESTDNSSAEAATQAAEEGEEEQTEHPPGRNAREGEIPEERQMPGFTLPLALIALLAAGYVSLRE